MPANAALKNEEGFTVHRCSPLPSFSQPLVVRDWRSYPQNGEHFFQIMCFVVTEEAILQTLGTRVFPRHLSFNAGRPVTLADVLAQWLTSELLNRTSGNDREVIEALIASR